MSSANFFGTDSPLVNLFLEQYDGDYGNAPSGENLRKIIKEIHMKNTDYLTKSSNYHFEKFKNEYRHEFRKKNDN